MQICPKIGSNGASYWFKVNQSKETFIFILEFLTLTEYGLLVFESLRAVFPMLDLVSGHTVLTGGPGATPIIYGGRRVYVERFS